MIRRRYILRWYHLGLTRTVGTDFDWFINTNSEQFRRSLNGSNMGLGIGVFAYGAGSNKNATRIASYHYDPAPNLATLEILQALSLSDLASAKDCSSTPS